MAVNSTAGFKPDQENVVYVGAGVTLKGAISVSDLLVVDGTVEGDVAAQAISVGETGTIHGKVTAAEADISGLVSDHIEIDHLLIVRSTGRVEGRVMYGEIELEKGAVVTGDLSSSGERRSAARPSVEKQQVALERVEPVATAPAAKLPANKAGNSINRLNEAVRAAKSGGAKPSVFLAIEKEPQRRNVLRTPLSSRRVSA
jgi:cytoskeletal protein CcmA (bactofilin family)